MRRYVLTCFAASLALTGLGFFTYMTLRRPDIPYTALDRKYADARSRFFTASSGVRVHYRDEGALGAPVLFLVHGYCASLHTWEEWAARLAAHYRVISIDLVGHGLTRAPADYRLTRRSFGDIIDATAAHLGLDAFALVGSSMGGAAAWDYAQRNPDRVTALALVGAAGFTPGPDQDIADAAVIDLLRSPMGPLLRDLDNTEFMRKGLRASFSDPRIAADHMVTRYVELARAPMNRALQMQIALNHDTRTYASRDALAAIRAPTLVLHGADDRIVPVADGYRFATMIPNARLIAYDEVGHIVHEEIPEQSADDLHAFLADVLPARAPGPARASASLHRLAA